MWKKLKRKWLELFDVYCREFRLVFHDGGIVLFFTFLPLVYPIIYSLIYNPELVRDVRLVVVDHDRTTSSRDLVRRLDATQEVWVIGYAADLNEARHALDSHEAYGILEIPDGFDRKIGRLEQAEAVLYSDMSLLLRYRGFLVATTNVMADMGGRITTERLASVAPMAETIATGDPMPVHNIAMGDTTSGFDSFIMPGVVILILHQCLILASGMAGGAKRERAWLTGYDALNAEPSTSMTMAGQILCYFTIIFVPAAFLYHYVPLIFRFPMEGNIFTSMIFLLPMVLACLGIGFMLQGVVRQRESVFLIWVVTSVFFLFLSGLTWPRYAMPGFWKALSATVPGTWGVEGFIRICSNGATIAQTGTAYRNLWILAAVYLAGGYCVQRWVLRPDLRSRLKYRKLSENPLTGPGA